MTRLTKRNYVDRDVSWMYFNHRILEEAKRDDIPVLERMSFLGIYSNNLDEFFRVRMAKIIRDNHVQEDGWGGRGPFISSSVLPCSALH